MHTGKIIQRQLARGAVIVAVAAIDFYRNYLSSIMLPRCRFYPTCSAYAREALLRKGLLRGLLMAVRRLLHCHPFYNRPYEHPIERPGRN